MNADCCEQQLNILAVIFMYESEYPVAQLNLSPIILFTCRGFAIGRFITYTTRHFATELQYNEVSDFFTANPPHGGAGAVAESLERIRNNIQWVETNGLTSCKWLDDNVIFEKN